MENTLTNHNLLRLSSKEFEILSGIIYDHFGIKMPLTKKTLLECRLQKRLKALDLNSFSAYIHLLKNGGLEDELFPMANVVTTNKTDFFRESAHFDFIKKVDWNTYFNGDTVGKTMKVWSAACSTGEEPYTLGMVLKETGRFDYKILATDISLDALQKAVTAVYKEDRIIPVPMEYRKKYFLKSKDKSDPKVRVVPEIRKKVTFGQLNLMDIRLDIPHKMDMIFCRNVLIYFDRMTQLKVVSKLIEHLRPGGFLFIGHSESISEFNLPLTQIKSTIYRKLI